MTFKAMRRRFTNQLALILATVFGMLALYCLAWILITLLVKGLPYLNWDLFTQRTLMPHSHGGLLNAILGSLVISTLAVLMGGVFGLAIGIYQAEYQPQGKLSTIVRFIIDILLGSPSIIFGLLVYEFYVLPQRHFSGWAGCLALSLMVFPIVARATENMYKMVPSLLREAVVALGASDWKVIQFLLSYVIKGGVLTGILLAFSRILGEAAPLLFTTLNNQFVSFNMNQPMANLPVVIYNYAMSPFEDWQHIAWSGALLMTTWVLSINIITRYWLKPVISRH
jgi:phosphate transport system permease protein